jgi:hypothetical protein
VSNFANRSGKRMMAGGEGRDRLTRFRRNRIS